MAYPGWIPAAELPVWGSGLQAFAVTALVAVTTAVVVAEAVAAEACELERQGFSAVQQKVVEER